MDGFNLEIKDLEQGEESECDEDDDSDEIGGMAGKSR
jgi:hypothetical protein